MNPWIAGFTLFAVFLLFTLGMAATRERNELARQLMEVQAASETRSDEDPCLCCMTDHMFCKPRWYKLPIVFLRELFRSAYGRRQPSSRVPGR